MRLGKTTAWLTEEEFKYMPEYSLSLPTLTTEGKTWKCRRGSKWYVGQYGKAVQVPGTTERQVPITWRKLVVMPPEHAHRV